MDLIPFRRPSTTERVLCVASFPLGVIVFVIIARGLVDTPFAVLAMPLGVCMFAWAIGVLSIILDSIPTSH